MFALLALAALGIEAAVGYPDWLWRTLGHPVSWVGRIIAALDAGLNRPAWSAPARRAAGVAAAAILVGVPTLAAWAVQAALSGPAGWLALAILAAALPAQRSLHAHVAAVADALDVSLEEGRRAVSMIVGRDVAALDAAGVARAAIESLAENFSDGIVAPAFWLAAGGLPGGVAYKAINTADSMIGHRTPRHEAFGWAAARLDDLVNLPCSRLAGLLLALAAGRRGAAALAAMRRDAKNHRSPNAGWPEAAAAGALGLSLAGPRDYAGVRVEDATMGDGRREATSGDIRAALALYRRACVLLWLALGAGAAAVFGPVSV